MTTLNVHLHEFDSSNKEGIDKLVELASLGPIAISLAPLHLRERRYDNNFLKLIREIVSTDGNLLGQRGNTNFCVRKEHKKLDKFHENRCPYSFFGNPLEVQVPFMTEGRQNLVDVFGKVPEIYTPPNHFYDGNTITIAKLLGFKYFSVYDVFGLRPYTEDGMTFVPERSCHMPGILDRLTEPYAIHTHLGHLPTHLDRIKGLDLTAFDQIETGSNFVVKRAANSFLKYALKYWRDISKLVRG